MVEKFIDHYNHLRLHSTIGYIAPVDKLNGREQDIFKERDLKPEETRELRKKKWLRPYSSTTILPNEDGAAPLGSLMQAA